MVITHSNTAMFENAFLHTSISIGHYEVFHRLGRQNDTSFWF